MDNQNNNASAFHDFSRSGNSIFSVKLFVVLFVVALAGIGSGYLLSKSGSKQSLITNVETLDKSSITTGMEVGSDDKKTFKDTTEGTLKEGGVEGEGEYHLVRQGGDSQNVYLTSSIVDLSLFINKKIKVWGQTVKAKKVGWLMDVGRIKVLE